MVEQTNGAFDVIDAQVHRHFVGHKYTANLIGVINCNMSFVVISIRVIEKSFLSKMTFLRFVINFVTEMFLGRWQRFFLISLINTFYPK